MESKSIKFKPTSISQLKTRIAADAVNIACSMLGVSVPVRFFAPDGVANDSWQWNKFARIGDAELKGICTPGGQVWVRSDLNDAETVITIGHEIYHHFELCRGYKSDKSEQEAEEFGRFVLRALQRKYRTPYNFM